MVRNPVLPPPVGARRLGYLDCYLILGRTADRLVGASAVTVHAESFEQFNEKPEENKPNLEAIAIPTSGT
jgi:hypothetical protein